MMMIIAGGRDDDGDALTDDDDFGGPDGDVTLVIREGVKKKPYLFGTLSQTSDPTHPPRRFGTPLSEK